MATNPHLRKCANADLRMDLLGAWAGCGSATRPGHCGQEGSSRLPRPLITYEAGPERETRSRVLALTAALFGRRRSTLFVLAGLHPPRDLLDYPPRAPVANAEDTHNPYPAAGEHARPPEVAEVVRDDLMRQADMVGQLLNAGLAVVQRLKQ
jgi:hypothetical protein